MAHCKYKERQGEAAVNFKDAQLIWHIRDYCRIISGYVARCGDFQTFLNDRLYRDGISMNLQQIGELVGRLSEEFKNENKNRIMWNLIKGMRNHFAHEYERMEKDIIWGTAHDDIPSLLTFCDELIASHPEDFAFPEIPEEDIL